MYRYLLFYLKYDQSDDAPCPGRPVHLSALVPVEAGLRQDRHRVVQVSVDQRVGRDEEEDREKQGHVHQEQPRVRNFGHIRSK